MSISDKAIKIAQSPLAWVAVAVAGYFLLKKVVSDIADGVTDATKTAVDAVTNVNAGTAYEGYGAVGTLGHTADAVSGLIGGTDAQGHGPLQNFGEWIGGQIYDWSHPEQSSSMQTASNKPFQAGTNKDYSDASGTSPVLPQYMGSPLNKQQVGVDIGINDPNSIW